MFINITSKRENEIHIQSNYFDNNPVMKAIPNDERKRKLYKLVFFSRFNISTLEGFSSKRIGSISFLKPFGNISEVKFSFSMISLKRQSLK